MALLVRNLKIDPPLLSAPMVGLSHSALRSLHHELGGVGLLFTEMLSAKRLPSENERCSPFLVRDHSERPLFYQVFISHQRELPGMVERLLELDAQGIDLNLGCPAPQLRKLGAGLEMLKDRAATIKIIKHLRKLTNLPLSVKIRLGRENEADTLLDRCRLFQDIGVDMITIHARYDQDKFCRKPNWNLLEPIAANLKIPIIANGGIFTPEDASRCFEISGADGIMIGRGGAHTPWLFRQIAQTLFKIEFKSGPLPKHEVYFRFIVLVKERFAPERRLGRVKQFTHYFASNYAFGHLLASQVQHCTSIDEVQEKAQLFFNRHEPKLQ